MSDSAPTLLPPRLEGRLLPRAFLDDALPETDDWRAIPDTEIDALAQRLIPVVATLAARATPNEAETETDLIFPVLAALGWHHLPQQRAGAQRTDIPDALLFADAADKEAAARQPHGSPGRYARAVLVQENKAWQRPLDRADADGRTAATQLLRYLRLAEERSQGAVRWGLLTNGRLWRLYAERAPSQAEGFVEADLPAILAAAPAARRATLRAFLLLLRPDAHRADAEGRTFLDRALEAGRRHEARITERLTQAVFDKAFPELVAAIAAGDPEADAANPAWRAAAGEAALVLLYRCLFVLYAEDRALLPVGHRGYHGYAFERLRDAAAAMRDQTAVVRANGLTWWPKMRDLFAAIAEGDPALGLPPYNGGLFSDADRPILARVQLRDGVLAELIEDLSREGPPLQRRRINYRDLSVQHLGTIYEGLLESEVALDPEAPQGVALRPNAYARKTSGSYYTPESLVRLVIRRAVNPLLADRRDAFAKHAAALGSDTRQKTDRLRDLGRHDPAEAFLTLKICDPAMGSGHFLVSLVDHLADATLAAMAEATEAVDWAEYRSPLATTLATTRARIQARAAAGGWEAPEHRLDDKALVRRILLKRVVHGVDLNPMAVELAKLSLWLHSFTVGAPLSFLDHHLRCGDSLFGEFVRTARVYLGERYGPWQDSSVIVAAETASTTMTNIELLEDSDIEQVGNSMRFFEAMESSTADLHALLDLVHLDRWLAADATAELGRTELFTSRYGNVVEIATGRASLIAPLKNAPPFPRKRGASVPAVDAHDATIAFLRHAADHRTQRRFLHWELAFPNIWKDWASDSPSGGFDAVIGNPPWDKVEIEDNTWFRHRLLNFRTRAKVKKAEVRAAVEIHQRENTELWQEFEAARGVTNRAVEVARSSGAYPGTSTGRVDLFALFAERGLRLLNKTGRLVLLVPTGLVADKRTANFFTGLTDARRIDAIFDFENQMGPRQPPKPQTKRAARKPANEKITRQNFFVDVHKNFKFCVFSVRAQSRAEQKIECAFFLNADETDLPPARVLSLDATDFAAVNPNTRTIAMFRGQREADLVTGIHRRFPVLELERKTGNRSVWQLGFSQMFNISTDRKRRVLRTREEFIADGWYAVAGAPGRLQRGNAEAVALLVGRMVHHYDHRYAAVTESEDAEENDAVGVLTTAMQHADPGHAPEPRWFVEAGQIPLPDGLTWLLAYRDIARVVDARTAIAAVIPRRGAGHTLPILPPSLPRPPKEGATPQTLVEYQATVQEALLNYKRYAPLLLGNLNSLPFDFIARQKMQSTHLSWYILQQMPMIPPDAFRQPIGSTTAEALIRDHVLRLSYTAHDLAPFARDQGHSGPPFRWDEDERLHLRSRLDALFFLLYGLDRAAAEFILGTFPIVEREERARWAGRFRSRDLILGYMAAFAAGDTESCIAG